MGEVHYARYIVALQGNPIGLGCGYYRNRQQKIKEYRFFHNEYKSIANVFKKLRILPSLNKALRF
jgi:hypothetical protein